MTLVERPKSRVRFDPAPGWTALAGGVHVRRMVDGNGSSISLYHMAQGRRFELHEHPFAELGVVLAGEGTLLVVDEERPLREGDSFYIPGGIPHGFAVGSDRPVVMLNVSVPQLPQGVDPPPAATFRHAALVVRAGPTESKEPSKHRGRRSVE
ncbi:MAG TPA: cupin domain-containing protein [Thermoplasmata archaeon]|nr:cupin domain-containing protein [Thermoplasmata archaeon]